MKKIPDLSKMQELTHLELSGLVELECFEIHENEEDFEQLSALSSLKDLSVQNTPVIEALFGLKECLALNRINVGFRGMDRERALALREHLDPVIVWIQPQRH